ncbi:MAG: hypothetical protein EA425_10785 [Puniceicoccaceae bacterium]|nr:MAG: hypothetical protein EA425_10785 [Puniceicoccaceae bacterium]
MWKKDLKARLRSANRDSPQRFPHSLVFAGFDVLIDRLKTEDLPTPLTLPENRAGELSCWTSDHEALLFDTGIEVLCAFVATDSTLAAEFSPEARDQCVDDLRALATRIPGAPWKVTLPGDPAPRHPERLSSGHSPDSGRLR